MRREWHEREAREVEEKIEVMRGGDEEHTGVRVCVCAVCACGMRWREERAKERASEGARERGTSWGPLVGLRLVLDCRPVRAISPSNTAATSPEQRRANPQTIRDNTHKQMHRIALLCLT